MLSDIYTKGIQRMYQRGRGQASSAERTGGRLNQQVTHEDSHLSVITSDFYESFQGECHEPEREGQS